MSQEQLISEIHNRLGYKRLNRVWAKLEIVLGLAASGAGLYLGFRSVSPTLEWYEPVAGLLLFVLGGYLALAGHRSHLYQSANDHTVLLIQEMRQLHSKGSSI